SQDRSHRVRGARGGAALHRLCGRSHGGRRPARAGGRLPAGAGEPRGAGRPARRRISAAAGQDGLFPQRPMSWSEAIAMTALTLRVGGVAVALAFLPALGLGHWLARREFRGKALVEAVIALPMLLPPVAVGLGLLLLFGRRVGSGAGRFSFSRAGLRTSIRRGGAPLRAAGPVAWLYAARNVPSRHPAARSSRSALWHAARLHPRARRVRGDRRGGRDPAREDRNTRPWDLVADRARRRFRCPRALSRVVRSGARRHHP